MKMKKIVFVLILFLINSCGYNSVLKNKQDNFSIISMSVDDKNLTSHQIKRSLFNYVGLKNKSKNYTVNIKSNINNRITSKDARGNPKSFELSVFVYLTLSENKNNYEKTFVKKFAYSSRSNKFDLKNYENTIIDNAIEKIALEINQYIFGLSE